MAQAPTMEQSEDTAPYITVAEAERLFSLGKNTGYALIRGPWRPFAVKLNGSIRLNRGELMKWAATNQGKVA